MRIITPRTLESHLLASRLHNVELYYLLAACIHALAFALAYCLHAGFGWTCDILLVVFALTNPIWAHAALGVWRWRQGRR